ncbi:MAG: formylglycine-generating enzyme family protein [Wenzhouxiangella sp.]|nr:formylglycine-generating enzyme family protein [Wenzhouxiangella sp.]
MALIAPAITVLSLALAGGWFWLSRGTDDGASPMVGAEGDSGNEAGQRFIDGGQGSIAHDRIELARSSRPIEQVDPDPILDRPAERARDTVPDLEQALVLEEAPETPEPVPAARQAGPVTPVPDEPVVEETLDEQLAEEEPSPEIQAPRLAGERFRDCPECPEMVVIPAGRFVMGSPADEAQRQATEGPQREVEIGRFAMARFETRFADWDLCLAEGGCRHRPDDNGWGGGDQPVIDVSWNDAQDYLAWLSTHTGSRYRLPTEAEWEYAARAGTTGRHYLGDCFDSATANFNARRPARGCPTDDFLQRPLPVASFPANPFGLHDMHGNVWEWVQDCANANYQGAPTDGSAWMRGNCNRGTVRGGAWHDWGFWLRAASRYSFPRDSRHTVGGFRVARELP